MTFKIEKDVPINAVTGKGKFAETLRSMKIGDSCLVPDQAAATNFHNVSRTMRAKVKTRKQPDGQYRVWRTE